MPKKPNKFRKSKKAVSIREGVPRRHERAEADRVDAESTPAKAMNSAEALQRVIDIVCAKAEAIARGLANAGAKGQLAQAKYLFEIARIYPAGEKMTASREENEESFTYNFLKRHGYLPEAENASVSGQKEDGIDAVK
jgi:hypothetical protein